MCTEGRRYLYLGRHFWRYLLWLVLSQKARKKPLISFQIIKVQIFFADLTTLAILGGIQGIGGAAMPPAGVSHFILIQFPFSLNLSDHHQLCNADWHSGSRISTFSCSFFSIRHILIRLGLGLSYWQCRGRGFDRIYSVRILSCPPLFLIPADLFDTEKHGVPRSTY